MQRPTNGEELENSNPCADVIPMLEWVERPDEETCRPCFLGPLVEWYIGELGEEYKSNLPEIIENPDVSPEDVASELDRIKQVVPAELQKRLSELDCEIQHYSEKGGPK